MAHRITELDWEPPWTSLVPLQANGDKPPLFFVHGLHGEVYSYIGISKRLAPDQPTYGFQAVGLDGGEIRHTTIEQMASHYVRELRAFQPDGPYSLAGYSMGGLIAFEMAQQLHRQGQRVAPLALLDTEPISGLPALHYVRGMLFYIPRRVCHHLKRWRQISWNRRIGYYRGRLASFRRLLVANHARPIIDQPPELGTQPKKIPGFQSYYHAVAVAYRLRPYPGQLDLFVSDSANPHMMAAWNRFAQGGVVRHRVSGEHH